MSQFSTSELALVAYASVKGSDGSLLQSNGFESSVQTFPGIYELNLSPDLAQKADRELVLITPSDGTPLMVSSFRSTDTKIIVSLRDETGFKNSSFAITVQRSVIPLPAVP